MDEIKAEAQTAFFIIKEWDGSWRAVTEIPDSFTIQREALRHDVKTGCREIYELLAEDDLARTIAGKLLETNMTDSQRASQAIRHALADRDIL